MPQSEPGLLSQVCACFSCSGMSILFVLAIIQGRRTARKTAEFRARAAEEAKETAAAVEVEKQARWGQAVFDAVRAKTILIAMPLDALVESQGKPVKISESVDASGAVYTYNFDNNLIVQVVDDQVKSWHRYEHTEK